MTLYKGEWIYEKSNPTTIKLPKFKQGDIIVFTQWYKINIILDNNDTVLTASGNLVRNFSSYCKGWEFIREL